MSAPPAPESTAGDQTEVLAWLSSGEPFSTADGCRRIDTHAACVFLSGDRAWKLKRALRYPYLDFSTPAKRRAALEAELHLNRRTAPELYLAVHPIVRNGETFSIGGAGEIVDWVLEMRRFPDGALLDELAAQGPLDPAMLLSLADQIYAFHDRADAVAEPHASGRLRDIIAGSVDSFEPHAALFGSDRIAHLLRDQHQLCDRHAALLDARGREGKVRHVHGDLHLANIALINGKPTPFDCLEFSETLATTDLLYDLAFLLMDLWHRGLGADANLVFNRYIDLSADEQGVCLLPLFLSVRASIRAHVLAAAGAQTGSTAAASQARDFFDLAERLIAPSSPRLVAVGGLSGTGKSTLARALGADLGAPPGARILRSDVLRKRLAGVSPEHRLAPSHYSALATSAVYALLGELAARHLAEGTSVIADAVFADPTERAVIAQSGAQARVPFLGLWLDASEAIRAGRVGTRTADASDADASVVRAQSHYRTGALDEWHRLYVDKTPTEVASEARMLFSASCFGPERSTDSDF